MMYLDSNVIADAALLPVFLAHVGARSVQLSWVTDGIARR